MLKMRFGADPLVDIKIPSVPPDKLRSSQCGEIRLFIPDAGRQLFVRAEFELVNCRLPLELAFTLLNVVP